jgi:hypothetical protein
MTHDLFLHARVMPLYAKPPFQLQLQLGLLSCYDGVQVNHEDFNEGIIQVQAKKKANLSYYA